MNHTQGGWMVDNRAGAGCFVTSNSVMVADCSPRAGGPMTVKESRANAKVIALLPAMADALKAATLALHSNHHQRQSKAQLISTLRALIWEVENS